MDVLFVVACTLLCTGLVVAGPPLLIVTVGLRRRRRMEQDLSAREQQVAHLLAATTPELGPGRQVTLVVGSVVYAPDTAARTAQRWRSLVGGGGTSMTQRMAAARRLATVRALEQARHQGARAVLNVRYQTSQLSEADRRGRQAPLVEIVAYGTAWVPA